MPHKQLVSLVILVCLPSPHCLKAKDSQPTRLEIAISDSDGQSLPCRIHLIDQQGKAHRVAEQPFWHDHFVCQGLVTTSLAPGQFEYAIERGPEYLRKSGQIEITDANDRTLNVTMERIANLRAAGWYSGDLHIHRPL